VKQEQVLLWLEPDPSRRDLSPDEAPDPVALRQLPVVLFAPTGHPPWSRTQRLKLTVEVYRITIYLLVRDSIADGALCPGSSETPAVTGSTIARRSWIVLVGGPHHQRIALSAPTWDAARRVLTFTAPALSDGEYEVDCQVTSQNGVAERGHFAFRVQGHRE
jgi:hypothetical protein